MTASTLNDILNTSILYKRPPYTLRVKRLFASVFFCLAGGTTQCRSPPPKYMEGTCRAYDVWADKTYISKTWPGAPFTGSFITYRFVPLFVNTSGCKNIFVYFSAFCSEIEIRLSPSNSHKKKFPQMAARACPSFWITRLKGIPCIIPSSLQTRTTSGK